MNTSASQQAWSQPEQALDPMAQMQNDIDDLGNLFEFGDIDLNPLPDVGGEQYGGEPIQQSQHISHPTTPYNGIEQSAQQGTSAQDFGGHHEHYGMDQAMDQQQYMPQDGCPPTTVPFTTEPMYQPSLRQAYHHNHPQAFQYQQQGYPQGHGVPPTPNSFEMHGEAGRFMQQAQHMDPQQRALLEQRFQLRKDDAIAFTPMVSPAGTPHYNVQPEFTIPGAYFSPLTSPMLHAQNAQNTQQRHLQQTGYYTNPSTAPSSNATSPIDPTMDMDISGDGMSLPDSAVAQSKKPRRKVVAPRSVASGKVRQSPIQKPQKRKSGMLASVVPSAKDTDSLIVEAQKSGKLQPGSAGLQMPPIFSSSEDGSISPEPLSESLMGPPPRPGSSLTQSPATGAQQQQQQGSKVNGAGAAATPKSLLSMRTQQPINGQPGSAQSMQAQSDAGLDDLQLPEAAEMRSSRRPSLSQINTQIPPVSSAEQTPRLSARKTPKLGPLDTPSSARPGSALASPSVVASPVTGSTPAALLKDRKNDIKSRSNKKRGSVGASSVVVSPALRPRISPSIKPLLPEGSALHSPTHALLLASKSNYQNLLEGNHLPGVSYPDSLSTGLTSKRTSHKVAEQGRRNRINEALKEMQSLLPPSRGRNGKETSNSDDSPEAAVTADPDSKESKEEATAKSNNSKAATVESANIYIKQMQQRDAEREALIAKLKADNAEMRRRFEEQVGAAASTEKAGAAIDSASPASVKVP